MSLVFTQMLKLFKLKCKYFIKYAANFVSAAEFCYFHNFFFNFVTEHIFNPLVMNETTAVIIEIFCHSHLNLKYQYKTMQHEAISRDTPLCDSKSEI